MKVVITGASGFIGRQLVKSFERHGWEIVQVTHKKTVNEQNNRQVYVPMENYALLGTIVGNCDCFVHLAWKGTRGSTRLDATLQRENVKYSMAGLQSILKVGCGRVITAGSQAEYGPHTDMITEESPCHPNTEYGKAKLAFYEKASRLCDSYGVDLKEPRFFSLYGPHDFEGTMITQILADMCSGRPCNLTEGIQKWDFLYISDAVDALLGLCQQNCPNGVYNFGSGDVRLLRDYVKEMAEITGTRSELRFGAVPYPDTGMVSLWPDVSRLKQVLNWEPKVSFADGIRNILTSMKENKLST